MQKLIHLVEDRDFWAAIDVDPGEEVEMRVLGRQGMGIREIARPTKLEAFKPYLLWRIEVARSHSKPLWQRSES